MEMEPALNKKGGEGRGWIDTPSEDNFQKF
jgi:hypothetical protein